MKQEPSKYQDVTLISNKNLFFRRVVYISFIIVFLVTVPLIILYTQGYRYNFKRGKIQKTGVFIVSSIPKKANVSLNGKIIAGEQTPSRIEKLLPADYEITLSKDGYHDWTKKLQISENSTTFAEDVILWKNILPTPLSAYKIIDWLGSLINQKTVFITNDRKIISLDFNNLEFHDLFQVGEFTNPQLLEWSNTNKKILVKSNDRYLIIDTERYYIKPIELSDNKYSVVKWNLNNDNVLYALNASGVWRIDLFTKEKKLVFNQNVTDFIINNDNIYYLYQDIIYKQKISGNNNPEIIDGIKCQKCQFLNIDFTKLILISPTTQDLYIIDPELKNKTIKKEARSISWLNKNTFLFYNNWEIWTYGHDEKEPKLITRVGSGISEALWHPEGKHIIFISEDKINLIELDNRELRNMTALFAGKKTTNLAIDDNGKNIYFSSYITDQENIMNLNIK